MQIIVTPSLFNVAAGPLPNIVLPGSGIPGLVVNGNIVSGYIPLTGAGGMSVYQSGGYIVFSGGAGGAVVTGQFATLTGNNTYTGLNQNFSGVVNLVSFYNTGQYQSMQISSGYAAILMAGNQPLLVRQGNATQLFNGNNTVFLQNLYTAGGNDTVEYNYQTQLSAMNSSGANSFVTCDATNDGVVTLGTKANMTTLTVSGGNVGIGTQSPQIPLDTTQVGNGTPSGAFYITTANTYVPEGSPGPYTAPSIYIKPGLGFTSAGGSIVLDAGSDALGYIGQNNIYLNCFPYDGTTAGNVGIGNQSPIYTLDVSGSGNFTKGIFWSGNAVVTGGPYYPLVGNPSGFLTAAQAGGVQSLTVTGHTVSGVITIAGTGNISVLTGGSSTILISGATGTFMDLTSTQTINGFKDFHTGISVSYISGDSAYRGLVDTSNNVSVDWNGRKLNYQGTSVDWQNQYLYSHTFGVPSVNWNSGYLQNSNGNVIMNWFQGQLFDNTETPVISIDYNNRILSGFWTASGANFTTSLMVQGVPVVTGGPYVATGQTGNFVDLTSTQTINGIKNFNGTFNVNTISATGAGFGIVNVAQGVLGGGTWSVGNGLNVTGNLNVNGAATVSGLNITGQLGFVGTKMGTNWETTQGINNNAQIMSRTRHIAKDNFIIAKLAFQNYIEGAPVETGLGHSAQICAAIEYPAGTITSMTFGGQITGTIANGGVIFSDLVPLASGIPEGESFWVRSWYNNPSGIYYSPYGNASYDEAAFGVTTPNLVTGGSVTPSTLVYFPLAVIAPTNKISVLSYGDSRMAGISDTDDMQSSVSFSRVIDRYYGNCNLGAAGLRLYQFMSSHSAQIQFAPYATKIICELGINDINDGQSLNQLLTNATAFCNLVSGTPVYWQTIYPNPTSSTDNWASVTGQTVNGNDAVRTGFNDMLRNYAVTGVYGYWEVADIVESSRNAGTFVANGTPNYFTNGTNGLHLLGPAYALIRDASSDPFIGKAFLPVNGGYVNGPLNVNGQLTISGQSLLPIYTANVYSGTFTGAPVNDQLTMVNTANTGALLVMPNANVVSGYQYIVKDYKGNAGVHNIVVTGFGGQTFDGSLTYTLNTNYQSVTFVSALGNWYII